MISRCAPARPRQAAGLTLVELVIAIAVLGVVLAGILGMMLLNIQHGTDPLVQKQELMIAESLLEEIKQKPFPACDPDDPQWQVYDPANSSGTPMACSSGYAVDTLPLGPQVNEDRYGSAPYHLPYDDVADYNGFAMTSGIQDITGQTVLPGYAAQVRVDQQGGVAPLGTGIPPADLLRIVVTVTGPDQSQMYLTGYRFRYAPYARP